MDFEAMDWEAEAKRITAAFGIPVEFTEMDKEAFSFRFTRLSSRKLLPEATISLDVQYRSDGACFFDVSRDGQATDEWGYSHLTIGPDGTCWRCQTSSRALTNLLVEGLANLGLMTYGIERAMKRSFTSNEELEALIANRPDMEFEAIDWEAEAARFVTAFDVDSDCKFVRTGEAGKPYYYLSESGAEVDEVVDDEFVLLSNGQYMSFIVYPDAYYFFISDKKVEDKKRGRECAFVGIHGDGTVLRNINTEPLNIVAEGVFNLGLYSSEVEATFKGVYLQSRKQAWETEHKARLAGERKNPVYDSMDWEAETKRIVEAFEMAEPCQFIRHGGRASCKATERTTKDSHYKLHLKNGMHAGVSYTRQAKNFAIVYEKSRCGVSIGWDGSHIKNASKLTKLPSAYAVHTLAKALFFLDLLTPEIEAAIDASISGHERVEWALEYEARYEL